MLVGLPEWREELDAELLHSEEAYSQWKKEGGDEKSDPDNEMGPISEIYDAYVTRLIKRLDKHHELYEKYIDGACNPEQFFQDVQAIKMLMEDFVAYMDRFAKIAGMGKAKKA